MVQEDIHGIGGLRFEAKGAAVRMDDKTFSFVVVAGHDLKTGIQLPLPESVNSISIVNLLQPIDKSLGFSVCAGLTPRTFEVAHATSPGQIGETWRFCP